MARRYAILQKKLEELESDLSKLFKDDTTETGLPYNHLYYEDIQNKFIFLNRFLSIEMKSHPQKPHHLHHIDERLTALETAFLNRVHLPTSSSDGLDALSTCSCTYSCLNEEGGMSQFDEEEEKEYPEDFPSEEFKESSAEEEGEEDPETFSCEEDPETFSCEEFKEEEDPETFSCAEFEEKAAEAEAEAAFQPTAAVVALEREEKKRRFWVGKAGRVVGAVVLAVAVGVATTAGFSGGAHYHGKNDFLVPT